MYAFTTPTEHTMQQYAVIQLKGHAASHPPLYKRLGTAAPTPLGHLWSTPVPKPEHASQLTQQLGGKGGKTWPTDGLGSIPQVYTFSPKQPTFQYGLHTSSSKQDSRCQAPMRSSPSQGNTRNGYKKPALLGLKPDGILIHPQQYNVPGLLSKSTPCQNGCNVTHGVTGRRTIPLVHHPTVHRYVAGSPSSHPAMYHSTLQHHRPETGQHLSPDSFVFASPNKNQTPGGVPSGPIGTSGVGSKECHCRPPKGGKPPEGYICHLCFTTGHYIYDCPKVRITPEFTNSIIPIV